MNGFIYSTFSSGTLQFRPWLFLSSTGSRANLPAGTYHDPCAIRQKTGPRPDFRFLSVCCPSSRVEGNTKQQDPLRERLMNMKLEKGSRMKAAIEKIVSAHGKMDEFIQGEDFYLRTENPPFLPLVIERHGASASVTHYLEQNGDLIPDPDMEFTITNSGEWFPVATQFATGHYRRAIYFEDDKKLVSKNELRSQIQFANMWAKNLIEQGFAKN